MGDLEDIYHQYNADVFRYLMVLCRSREVAEELTQETFYQAVKSINRYNGECKMSVWLCQIAKHSYYKYLDKTKKQRGGDVTNQILQQTPESVMLQSEEKIALYRSIHLLKDPYKEVLLLRMLAGLSFREIGEIQRKNENWARVTYYRAKQKLKEGVQCANEG